MNVCFYFQVHQPHRLRKYRIFDIGQENYFDDEKNKEIMEKVSRKCYLPTNALLLSLLKEHPEFKIAFSLSGTAIKQFPQEVLDSFKALAATGQVEFLQETSHHSLASIESKEEFLAQLAEHKHLMKDCFGITPTVFRNTELIYSNAIASLAKEAGYNVVLMEGADHILDWRSPTHVYQSPDGVKLLLKHYKLSDDIAFRFSEKSWSEWPLTVEKFVSWLPPDGESVNLFMDYETFGEHQWEESGIFDFLKHLPAAVLKQGGFVLPSELARKEAVGVLDVVHPVSWADVERDLSAWKGNHLQDDALRQLYALETTVKAKGDEKLLADWRKLTTSDHFYYMCTKWFNDGDVHKYFNPFDSPYDAYMNFMHVLADVKRRLAL